MEASMIQAPEVLQYNVFARSFAATAATDPWFHVGVGAYTTSDGGVTPLAGGGLRVAPQALSDPSGTPMFTQSLPPESLNGGVAAANDHPKWLAYLNERSSAGYPGFDAVSGPELSATAQITGRTFGTEFHPFGAAVINPFDDLRLATFGMTTIDVESWMAFDFLFTKERAYAFYERLPFGRTEHDAYAAFSYAIPVKARKEDDVHIATIAYDAAARAVRWILDGSEVYRVTRIGRHLQSREHLLIDLGGAEQEVRPRQLTFGIGLFTLLDGAIGDGPGLVRLSDQSSYHAPRVAARRLSFVDEHSRPESRLFSQGAELSVHSYVVSRR
jgi:hypothetical protein